MPKNRKLVINKIIVTKREHSLIDHLYLPIKYEPNKAPPIIEMKPIAPVNIVDVLAGSLYSYSKYFVKYEEKPLIRNVSHVVQITINKKTLFDRINFASDKNFFRYSLNVLLLLRSFNDELFLSVSFFNVKLGEN